MNAQLIYTIACAAVRYGMFLKIVYNDGTSIKVYPGNYKGVKNPRYNNGCCMLYNDDPFNPDRFVFYNDSIKSITIF